MSDLNSWRLVAPGVSLAFGTESTDYPFKTQFSMGETERDIQDGEHSNSDGIIMGRDRLRGGKLEFECRILSEYPVTEKPWVRAMDLYSKFAAQWRADSVRLKPGEYATIVNEDRERLTYGRPRGIAPKSDMLRKGIYDFQMDFATITPDWYTLTEKSQTIQGEPASLGRLFSPLIAPITTVTSQDAQSQLFNDGELQAMPVVEFHGPSPAASLEVFSGEESMWTLEVPETLRDGDVLIVDTQFWQRSVLLNGKPANGKVTGSQLHKCKIPLGEFNVRFRHQDRTGRAYAVIRWRDTYAGP